MHLSDGILPAGLLAGCWVATIGLAGLGLKRMKPEDLPTVAVTTSSFFVASLIHVPVGPTSVHLLLPGLVGVLLGETAFVAILMGVVLQSLFFQFGGITAIGANALIMGVPALLAGMLFNLLRSRSHVLAGGLAGGLAIVLATLLLAGSLAMCGEDFLGVARLTLITHLPVAIIEAIIVAATVSFLAKVKPELIGLCLTPSLAIDNRHESH